MSDAALGTALITGASTGIGAVYADRLARRGYDLILVARDITRTEALAARLSAETGRTIEILPADLTKSRDVTAVEAKLAANPSITLLLNNAGMSLKGSLLDNDAADFENLIALNITAPTRLASVAGKAFVARKHGAIINISSVLALAPEMLDGVYSGSKAYILNLSLSLAAQTEGTGLRDQAVLPGATRTEIWERAGKNVDDFPEGFVMGVNDLVDAALAGFDKGETITIPPLADEGAWTAYNAMRLALAPNLSKSEPAARYRVAETA